MRVISPEQVITDERAGWVNHGHRPDQRERFVSLQV
jgi:hypothetical protein